MRKQLELVRGAVSKKDLLPVLTHFAFKDERVYGYNGRVHISAPVAGCTLSLTTPAGKLLAALDSIDGGDDSAEVDLSLHEGRLRLAGNKLEVMLPCGLLQEFPFANPPGKSRRLLPGFIDLLRPLRGFIGEDASRPWSAGIKFTEDFAIATNNVVVVRRKLPPKFPRLDMALPVHGVDELLRIDADPVRIAAEANALTFAYSDGSWVRCTLHEDLWPDTTAIFANAHAGAKLREIESDDWLNAVERIRPFCPDPHNEVVVLEGTTISTLAGDMSAQVSGFRFAARAAFHAEPLVRTLALAEELDLSRFPRVPWRGHGLEGVLLGVVT